ncbi:MAG: hypothetical protein V2A71_09485, partial [Candidatus Eisenbacteria bacterium]
MVDCKKFSVLRTAGLLLASLMVLGLASGIALAALPEFELDGNVATNNASPGLPDDWDRVNGYVPGNPGGAALSTGVLADPEGLTRFTQGSTDLKDIGDWRWDDANSPDKAEITNAYATLYAGNKLYFGADRAATNGTTYIAFWLLQGNISLGPGNTFTGSHVIGDILILSDFTQGGGVSTIRVFRWVGTGGSEGSLDELAVNPTTAFAIVNTGAVPSPWPYTPKTGPAGTFPTGAFFEGGADLGALGITEPCFANFLAETRASASITAELKDFVLGRFPAVPSATVNSEAVCDGESAQLCATVTGGVGPFTYSWTGPGAFTATTQCINVSVAGTYTVTVTGGNDCPADPASGTLTVNPLPVCSITGGADGICQGATTEWCAPVAPGGMTYTYSWTGPSAFTSTNRCITIGTAGRYTVVITDQNGCQSTCYRDLTVYSEPVCSITGGADAVCSGATTEWCAPVAPGGMTYTYSWTGPSAFTSTNRCITIGTAGRYTV